MNYWLLKGNPRYYDWDRYLRVGRKENWHSRFAPKDLHVDDRVFLWESGGASRIIGLAVVAKPVFRIDEDGYRVFAVRYLTARLSSMPGIESLRENPLLAAATFLKPAIFRTVYPLSVKEAGEVYRKVVNTNPGENLWRDIAADPAVPDVDESAIEGTPKLVTHLRRERDRTLVKNKKAAFRAKHGKLFCECCGADHNRYGDLAEGLFEVHHRVPLGGFKGSTKTLLSQLAIVCSNCHRAIHRTSPLMAVEFLGARLRLDVCCR